jgi:serine/threonine protein kinase
MAEQKIRLPLGEAVVSWRGVSYINLEKRGEGGSAAVYRTVATTGPRRGILFAVKLFRAPTKANWQVNFMREVHVLRDCDHPAIMNVFDEGMYLDQYPFVVMEYLPFTLADCLKEEMTNTEKIGLLLHLLSALNYLSRREPPVVHRDIKPPNIFMKAAACVLGDFGLILQVGEERRKSGAAEMAQRYRTPELVSYHNGGPEPPPVSDVFQLGLVAAELFTGLNPLKHEGAAKPVTLTEIPKIQGKLGEPIRNLLAQMLIINTANRPSASDILSQFQELYLAEHRRERTSATPSPQKTTTHVPETMVEPTQAKSATPEPPKPPPRKFGEGILEDDAETT